MTINERIKARREELGLTQEELASRIGFRSKTSISKIEAGGRPLMQDKVLAFAKALEMTPVELLGWGDEEVRGASLATDTNIVPVLGTVCAGSGMYAEQNIIGTVSVDPALGDDLFALRIHGNSMSPRISDGDTVIVRKQEDAESGQIVIAVVNGDEGVCKRLIKFNGGIILQSLNPDYEPMTFTDEQIKALPVTIVGRVIQNRCDF